MGRAEPAPLPSRAQVVIAGAGVIGASIAYHLVKLGYRDVLVLERKSIGCGTSWHSHGVVGLVRASPTLLRMAMETARMMADVEAASGLSTGYSVRGSVNVTTRPERMTQFRRFADIARAEGLAIEVIDGPEAVRLHPHLAGDGLLGGIHLPTEGQCNPLDLTQALLGAARKGGALVAEHTPCIGLRANGGRICAVETPRGIVECDALVNATGLWGRDFLRQETGGLPLQGVEHNYLVAEFSSAIAEGLPLLRDPDLAMTLREDARQLSIGFNDREAKIFAADKVPETFEFDELPPDWDAAMPYLEDAMVRVPILAELGIRLFMCGPEAVTPDTRYLLGPWGLPNHFVAAGFSGIGVGSSGGAGLALARWIIDGHPPAEVADVDVARMQPFQANRVYLAARATEASGLLFAVNWPYRQNKRAREVRRTPLHGALAAANAVFSEVAGWEVADFFAPTPVAAVPQETFGTPHWTPVASAEVAAARQRCAICDQSGLAKFLVVGSDAEAALLAHLTLPPPPLGGSVRCALLNSRGGVEAILTVVRSGETAFLLIADNAGGSRLGGELRARLAPRAGVSLVEMTSAYALLDIVGPRAEETLIGAGWRMGPVKPPPGAAVQAEVGYATATLLADDRLAAPAWRAIVPSEFAACALEALMDAAPEGSALLGRHGYRYLRTAAGSPLWGEGVGPDQTLLEARLFSLLDLAERRDVPGREVCQRQAREGVRRALVTVELEGDDLPPLIGHEPIGVEEELVGSVEQAAYALGGPQSASVGLGYLRFNAPVPADVALEGLCTVDLDGKRYEARYSGVGVPGRVASAAA